VSALGAAIGVLDSADFRNSVSALATLGTSSTNSRGSVFLTNQGLFDGPISISKSTSALLTAPTLRETGIVHGAAILAKSLHTVSSAQLYVTELRSFDTPEVTPENWGVVTFHELGLAFENETGEEINLIAYDFIYGFERGLRSFIDALLTRSFGPAWARQRVPSEVLKRWRERRATAIANGEVGQPLLEYADFTDYAEIIGRRDNWSEIFQSVFPNKEDVLVALRRLNTVRVPVMHSRQVTEIDLLMMHVEICRLRRVVERAGFTLKK
jgi:hypothetical protein